ncbi:sensor histidine kinase [Pedobacter sp. L105]|uniref:sensor histidine kinase n=1 Tax=Pedobacter sp. L105 TaxID=1641871 RepID=UPI00131E8EA5|nr:histidine kinase [Pedobacter sp. L105]
MITNLLKNNPLTGFFGSYLYFLLSLLICIPVFIGIDTYLQSAIEDVDALSFAGTVCFILCIFSGRYFSQFWVSTLKSLPKPEVFIMTTLMTICIICILITGNLHGNKRILLFFLPWIIFCLLLGIMIKVIHTVTQNQLQEAQSLAAHSKSELHLLQSQLSPHFLFNTLNNLYGISISDHQKIPDLLLKLAELLRYSVYEANEMYVPLKDEMAYINNYIAFEKIRIGDRLVLTTDLEDITDTQIKIAPMLLIVFIENAFKHSKNTMEDQIFVDIKLKVWGNSILFSIKNSYQKQEQKNNLLDKSSGFGLVSVNKRLALLYPSEHLMNLQQKEIEYSVDLQLNTK